MKLVPLYSKGIIVANAMVDDEDFDLVNIYRWRRDRDGYAIANAYKPNTDPRVRTTIKMHRLVMGVAFCDSHLHPDHKNHNPLDNQRGNLVIVTNAENQQNKCSRGGTSRYRGVTYDKKARKWVAQAAISGKTYRLGASENEDEMGVLAARWRSHNMPHSTEGRERALTNG